MSNIWNRALPYTMRDFKCGEKGEIPQGVLKEEMKYKK
jgi:hypothetical protein